MRLIQKIKLLFLNLESKIVDLVSTRDRLAYCIAAISLCAGTLAYFFTDYAALILLFQGILLTTVFSIGQNRIEQKIREECRKEARNRRKSKER